MGSVAVYALLEAAKWESFILHPAVYILHECSSRLTQTRGTVTDLSWISHPGSIVIRAQVDR